MSTSLRQRLSLSLIISIGVALVFMLYSGPQASAEDVMPARAGGSNHYVAAIREYERALKVDRDYGPALHHLAETYILYGKSLEAFPFEGLKQFHRAYFFDNYDSEVEGLIDSSVQKLGLNPASFDDQRRLGEAAFERGDFVDSVIELKMARKIRDDVDVEKKLVEAQNKLAGTLYGDRLKDTVVKAPNADAKDDKTDYGPYMNALQKQIKLHWSPPKVPGSRSCAVKFKVERNGALKNLKLSQSSGISGLDMSALSAVREAAPFSSLPNESRNSVDIQFTFDYNNYSQGTNARSSSPASSTAFRGTGLCPSLAR